MSADARERRFSFASSTESRNNQPGALPPLQSRKASRWAGVKERSTPARATASTGKKKPIPCFSLTTAAARRNSAVLPAPASPSTTAHGSCKRSGHPAVAAGNHIERSSRSRQLVSPFETAAKRRPSSIRVGRFIPHSTPWKMADPTLGSGPFVRLAFVTDTQVRTTVRQREGHV